MAGSRGNAGSDSAMVRKGWHLRRIKPCLAPLCGALAAGCVAVVEPLADYRQSCEAPQQRFAISGSDAGAEQHRAARDASAATCAALAERLAALSDPKPEERLALFKARSWLGRHASVQARCEAAHEVAAYFPERPELLIELAHCAYVPAPRGAAERRRADEKMVRLLRTALTADPTNVDALRFLIEMVRHVGYEAGMDAATLAGHAAALYETTGDVRAAAHVYDASLDAGDSAAAAAIRQRVQAEAGLDSLDYDAEQRADSLARACSPTLFAIDLEEYCVGAVEMLAGNAAAAGEGIPNDVLGQLEDAFDHLQSGLWKTGAKTSSATRLRAVLGGYPEALRSPEHHRVYAATVRVWGDLVEPLRRAVELDGADLAAKCKLATALAAMGAFEEAASLYAQAAQARGTAPCDPEERLRILSDPGRREAMRVPADTPIGGRWRLR